MSTTRQYELVYIVTPDRRDEQVAELHTQIEQIVQRFSGTLDKTENWGRRKLAYEIGHHREGTYVVETITGSGELMKEIDRRLRVLDQVIRHLIVRVDEELRVAERTRDARRRPRRGAGSRAACRRAAAGRSARRITMQDDDRATGIAGRWRCSDERRTWRPRPRRREGPDADKRQGRRSPARRILPSPARLQVLRGEDRLHQLQGRAPAAPFLPERGKIQPRRISGTCALHQRKLQTAIKRARQLALIPSVTD